MKSLRTKHRAAFATTLVLLAGTVVVNRCGLLLEYGGECWTEPLIAVIGGTLLSTEGAVHLTQRALPPEPRALSLADPLIPNAMAAAFCPTLADSTKWSCVDPDDHPLFTKPGPVLQVRYQSCKFPSRTDQLPGYWYGYHWLKFPTQTDCEAVKAAQSFTGVNLTGKAVTRTWGRTQSDNQQSFRLSQVNEFASLWTDFPSGWYDPGPQGGVEVAFGSGGVRTLKVKGVHAVGYVSLSKTKFQDTADGTEWDFLKQGLDLGNLPNLEINKDYRIPWDHTIDTPADELFTGTSDDPARAYSTITATGTGASRQITSMKKVRIQHNTANRHDPKTVSVSSLATDGSGAEIPLTWEADPLCCWPTAGTIHTDFPKRNDLNPRPDWQAEEVVFTNKCGLVQYKAYLVVDPLTKLPISAPDITVLHRLTECF